MEFDFKLTAEQLNLVLNGLAELPFKISQPLIAKLAKDYEDQRQPKVVVAE